MTNPAADVFAHDVRVAAEGTPYSVTDTEDGFDVAIDMEDARWHGLLQQAGVSSRVTHHVKVRPDTSYTITDDVASVEWVAGVPRVAASAQRMMGRVVQIGRASSWGFDEFDRLRPLGEYRFDTSEGRQLIEAIGDELHLKQRMGAAEKIGLGFAIVTLAGIVIGGLAVLVMVLLGVFPGR